MEKISKPIWLSRCFVIKCERQLPEWPLRLAGWMLLSFTGGIGEHADELRKEICSGLEFLGAYAHDNIPAQEDLQIAKITAKLVASSDGG